MVRINSLLVRGGDDQVDGADAHKAVADRADRREAGVIDPEVGERLVGERRQWQQA